MNKMHTFEEKKCPICQEKMIVESTPKHHDYICRQDDHFYSIRMAESIKTSGIELRKLKIKLGNLETEPQCFFLRINYDEDTSEVWSSNNDSKNTIKQVFTPDFSNIPKLKNKIRTLLIFS